MSLTDDQKKDLDIHIGFAIHKLAVEESIDRAMGKVSGATIGDYINTIFKAIKSHGYDLYKIGHHISVEHTFEVVPDGDGYFIQFPALPGCMTQVDNVYEAAYQAADAYEGWIAATVELGQEVPPSDRADEPAHDCSKEYRPDCASCNGVSPMDVGTW